jgi:hypothetical protein
VRLKYLAGYPLPGVSDAQAEVIVTRTFEWKGATGAIDLYLAAREQGHRVMKLLHDHVSQQTPARVRR